MPIRKSRPDALGQFNGVMAEGRWNVNESLRVVWKHDPVKGLFVRERSKTVIGGIGNGYVALGAAAFQPDDDVLLQHVVILERLGS